jgi:hypothetical protein
VLPVYLASGLPNGKIRTTGSDAMVRETVRHDS